MMNEINIINKGVPVVVGFKRTILVETQVFCLLVSKLGQVGIKSSQMETGNIFICNTQIRFSLERVRHKKSTHVCWVELCLVVTARLRSSVTAPPSPEAMSKFREGQFTISFSSHVLNLYLKINMQDRLRKKSIHTLHATAVSNVTHWTSNT